MRIEEHFGDTGNGWTAFDALVSAAHTDGIKIVVDFAPNHSNPDNGGEYGSLYNNGTFMAACNNDSGGSFTTTPTSPTSMTAIRFSTTRSKTFAISIKRIRRSTPC